MISFNALPFLAETILRETFLFFLFNLRVNSTLRSHPLEGWRESDFKAIRRRVPAWRSGKTRSPGGAWKMRNVSDGNHLCARQIFVIILKSWRRWNDDRDEARGRKGDWKGKARKNRGVYRGEEAIDIDFVPKRKKTTI